MATRNFKTVADLTKTTAASSDETFVKADTAGKQTAITMQNLQAQLMTALQGQSFFVNVINREMDNIFIMYHRKSDNYPLMVKPSKWTSLQTSGEVADGVVVVTGDKLLVVAPTETSAYWSSAAVSGGGITTTDRVTAYSDWAGKSNTAAQIKHTECSDAAYAPGYCAAYSRVNANGSGLTAGSWWLPSLGELLCIYANMLKINYALGLISGATQLAETWYWSSSECSAAYAWYLSLGYGNLYLNPKATYQLRVRPVAALVR